MKACGLALLLFTGAALACDCKPAEFEQSRDRAEHIFLGRVASIDRDRVAFRVGSVWKGEAPVPELRQGQGADCVFNFETGRDYVVFTSRNRDGQFEAGTCGFTTEAENACSVIARLGEPTHPRPDFPWTPAAVALGLTCVGLLSRRTRRFAPLLLVVGAAATVGEWRGQRTGPSYPLNPPADPAASAGPVPVGVEREVSRGERAWGLAFGATGDVLYGAEQLGTKICAYPLTTDAGTRCVDADTRPGALAVTGDRLVVSARRGFTLWALPSLDPLGMPNVEQSIDDARFMPSGSLATAAGRSVVVVDPFVGRPIRVLDHAASHGDRVAISGDGRKATLGWSELGSDDRWHPVVGVFSTEDGGTLAQFTRSCGGARWNVALDARGETLAWFEADGLVLYDVTTQRARRTIGGAAQSFALSPDGTRLAVAADELVLWDTASGEPVLRFPNDGGPGALAFSRDGQRLAVGDQGRIRILETNR